MRKQRPCLLASAYLLAIDRTDTVGSRKLKYQAQVMILVSTCFALCGQSIFAAEKIDLLTTCSSMIDRGEVMQSIELQRRAIEKHPEDGRVRAVVSWCEWRQGNMIGAIDHAQKAVELLPNEFLPIFNLARMQETFDACKDAITLYEKAQSIEPENPEPRLGISRCYFRLDESQKALAVLAEMRNSAAKHGFAWSLALAKTYSRLGEAAQAADVALIAASKASNRTQISQAQSVRMLALLKTGDMKQADRLFNDVFVECTTKDYELFVRAASGLVQANQTDRGRIIVAAALQNLGVDGETEGLFRLGRILQDKASQLSKDRAAEANQAEWLELADDIYRRAVSVSATESRLHLANGSVQFQQGKQSAAVAAFEKALSIEPLNPWLSQLVSLAKSPASSSRCFSHVSFQLRGLNCGCHASRIASELAEVSGVKFVHIDSINDFAGTLIVDDSTIQPNAVWDKCREAIARGPVMQTPIQFNVENMKVSRISGLHELVCVSQNALCGDPLKLYPTTSSLEPIKPVEYSKASYWILVSN